MKGYGSAPRTTNETNRYRFIAYASTLAIICNSMNFHTGYYLQFHDFSFSGCVSWFDFLFTLDYDIEYGSPVEYLSTCACCLPAMGSLRCCLIYTPIYFPTSVFPPCDESLTVWGSCFACSCFGVMGSVHLSPQLSGDQFVRL